MEFTFYEFIQGHINGPRHGRARSMGVQPYNSIFSVEGSDDVLWCKICQVYLENYIETIFEHVDEDKEHNVRLSKILRLIEGQNITIDAYLTNPTEDKATCNKCSTGVSCNVDNLGRHIKGKQHRK
ncbi:jg17364 [Pararge aegeria aegeria]|uniref:Jg17364 protein n=1 Tax=Pararge aegeria aegeria TaxID=348720 RepID=A0A8S4RU93_9NEOP|nr:jg17364 [Pararge aegeria aegeria]